METTQAQDFEVEAATNEVFSLPTILDPSDALAAAQRLYEKNRSGLRFFCENRRVVSVEEAEAACAALEQEFERGAREPVPADATS